MKKTTFFLFLLLSGLFLRLHAQDYITDINNSSTAAEGHQVIYEMNVGAFTPEGTFNAASEKLAGLKQTGVDIVWLMPVYPRGGGINSPYASKNFRQVNPSYGTISELKDFVAKAHGLGMKVWLDWVPNHTATDAEWVTSHPEYYTTRNGQMVHPNNYGDVYELNYNNADLQNEMNDCMKFWIDETDIDGFRCDYVSSPSIPATYWQTAIPLIKNHKRGKDITFLAEADIVNDAKKLLNSGFDYDYAWQLQSQMVNYGPNGNTSARLKAFANTLVDGASQIAFGRMLYLTNHDQNWNESKQTLTAKYGDNRYPLTVFTFTIYGMPLIYNGQEIGGNQPLNYFEDTKIDWNSTDKKMLNTIRTLCAIKHHVPALNDKAGVEWETVTNNSGVLAFTRTQGDSEILVLLNMNTTAASATVTGLKTGEWSLWLDSETIAQGVSRKQTTLNGTYVFNLEAKGYQVYVKGTYPEEELPPVEAYTPTLDSEDEISIFFETSQPDSYNAWVWGELGGGEAYCTSTSWPGDAMQLMGQSLTGSFIYKYTVSRVTTAPEYLIISKNGGNTKIYDGIAFVNHGYYVEGNPNPTQIVSTTSGITTPGLSSRDASGIRYDLNGRRLQGDPLPHSIYIQNGKKHIQR